ncbi:hypothetical protein [Microtetraspora sp. NBRC 16547]|uniref:hypothetical protein n=1 Tax=Microtetraspora sp. NBRC 16547 TaxID=3030993 RepID=UPI0024A3FDC4|nr:hypothetical protein [Microtetraspora sp. NBRC 16547]GLW99324.1 hypothetical protein Misp02_34110 [Microtetraspora sp. NBRC 16547]
MNLIEAKPDDGNANVGGYIIPVTPASALPERLTIGVRPEAWRIVSAHEGGLPIDINVIEALGSDSFVYGSCAAEGVSSTVIRRPARRCTGVRHGR